MRIVPIVLLAFSGCSGSTGGTGGGSSSSEGETTNPSASATSDPGSSSSATSPTSADTGLTTIDTGGATSDDSGSDTGPPAELDGWTRRRPVLVTNTNDADMVDHQVMVDIDWDDDMAPMLVDLRFTDADGVLLPHWVEKFVAPVSGRIWVRVPLVPAEDETTIYMWYGNPDAPDGSTPEQVFDLWESFDADLDAGDWSSSTNGYEVANGRLTITSGSVYSNVPMVALPGLQVEILARWPAGDTGAGSGLTAAEAQGAIGDQDLLTIGQYPLHYTAVDGPTTLVNANWTNPPGAPGDEFEWHGVAAGAGLARFSRTHDYDPAYVWWQQVEADIPNDYYLWLGHSWGSLAGTDDGLEMEIDVLLARKFADIPAGTSVGGEDDF